MQTYEAFIDQNRQYLLQNLEPWLRREVIDEAPLDFIQRVIDTWFAEHGDDELGEATSSERAFWYTLYQLEDFAEIALQTRHDPMLGIMEDGLRRMHAVLTNGGDLPPGTFATRPDGDPVDPDEFDVAGPAWGD